MMSVFQRHARRIRGLAEETLASSSEYSAVVQDLDATLLLADRVLTACEGHPDLVDATDFGEHLSRLLSVAAPTKDTIRYAPLHVEMWMQAVLWLAKPSQRARGGRQLNLYDYLRALQLLSRQEVELARHDAGKIPDKVRQLILLGKEHRNDPAHGRRHVEASEGELLLELVLEAIVPVYKHRIALRLALRDLIVRELPAGALAIVRSTAASRAVHLPHFAGREDFLHALQERLGPPDAPDEDDGSYLLVLAPEGGGKSALCMALSERLAGAYVPLGPAASAVRRAAPWLPAVILATGKQAPRFRECAEVLVAQANTLLLEPVELPSSRLQVNGQPIEGLGGAGLIEPLTPARALLECRRAVTEALEQVVLERGECVVVIDALDEIGTAETLAFLPENLPSGCHVLLTSRPKVGIDDWLRANRRVVPLTLQDLTRAEVPLVTGVDDHAGPDEKRFNDEVFERCRGWVLHVAYVGRDVRRSGGDHCQVDVPSTTYGILEAQARKWCDRGPLEDTLRLLGVFERCTSLALDEVQEFLATLGHELRKSHLTERLGPVSDQLEGLDAGKVKLTRRPFADYIVERFCSARDLAEILRQVVAWLGAFPRVGAGALGAFLVAWGPHGLALGGAAGTVADALIAALAPQGGERLYTVAREALERDESAPVTLACLRAAAGAGHARAMVHLALLLLTGTGVAADEPDGERWLRLAADAGEDVGMYILGMRLAGSASGRASDEAGLWLRRSAALLPVVGWELFALLTAGCLPLQEVAEAERHLRGWGELKPGNRISVGECYALGVGVPQDETEAVAWWRAAGGSGDSAAARAAGLRLSRLPGFEDEGRQLLARAGLADEPPGLGPAEALTRQGLLVDPADSSANWKFWNDVVTNPAIDFGLRAVGVDRIAFLGRKLRERRLGLGSLWTIWAARQGNPDATVDVWGMLASEPALEPSGQERSRWAARAAVAGRAAAQYELGQRLLRRGTTAPDQVEGIRWLRAAADGGDPRAMWALSVRLRHGRGVDRDPAGAEGWLRRAVDRVEPGARDGSPGDAINLAYLCRRGDVPSDYQVPLVEPLLAADGVPRDDSLSRVNLALGRAAGFQSAADWTAADDLMSRVHATSDLCEWWRGLAEDDDPEGHLVLGWLARHGRVADPDDWSVAARMAAARGGGLPVPEWLDAPAAELTPWT